MIFEFTYTHEPIIPDYKEVDITVIANVEVLGEQHPASWKVIVYQARVINFQLYDVDGREVSGKYKFLTEHILREFIRLHHQDAIDKYVNQRNF